MLRSSLFKITFAAFFICFPAFTFANQTAPDRTVLNEALEAALQSPGKVVDLAPYRDPATAISKKNTVDASTRLKIDKSFGKMPLLFEKNEGQTDKHVKFISRGSGNAYSLYLTPTEAVMVLSRTTGGIKKADPMNSESLLKRQEDIKTESSVIRMKLIDSNPDPKIYGQEKQITKSNYLTGNDQSKWRTGVTNFGKVRYEDVYPGIDLLFYGNQRKLEYDFVVKPGADPKAINFKFDGEESIVVDWDGNLRLETKFGEIVEKAPIIYQEEDGKRKTIEGKYVLAENMVSFELDEYDNKKELVIDPVVTFSSFIGHSNTVPERAVIAVDASSNVYVAGTTRVNVFPTENPLQPNYPGGQTSGFIVKIDSSGNRVYSTYFGGSGNDWIFGIEADSSGNVFVSGYTGSLNFPIVGAFQPTYGGGDYDVFVTKINSTGQSLIYSTYLGGSGRDASQGKLAIDSLGRAIVTGITNSSNFPMINAYHSAPSGNFLTKLNASGNAAIFSTYLSLRSEGWEVALALDSSDNIYLGGETRTGQVLPNPTEQAIIAGDRDMLIYKMPADASSIIWSTYYGGSGREWINDIAVDPSGDIYAIGATTSTDFPTVNAFQGSLNGVSDVAIVKLNNTGTVLYSTYFGGEDNDLGWGVAGDSAGNAYLVGRTNSSQFPLKNNFSNPAASSSTTSGFLAKINTSGSNLEYSTYFGYLGAHTFKTAIDSSDNVYIVGQATEIPLVNPIITQGTQGPFFAAVIEDGVTPPPPANDFDSDGDSDILSIHSSGLLASILIQSSGFQDLSFPAIADPAQGWTVNATGDFNGDRKADLLLYNTTTGEYRTVLLDGTTVISDTVLFTIDPAIGVEPRGVGDFDGDGEDEIIVHHPVSGFTALVYLVDDAFSSFEAVTTVDAANDWTLKTTGHFNGDNKTDLLIINTVTGEGAVIEMDGSTASTPTPIFTLDPATGWTVEDTGDFTGNGSSDILILHTTGALGVLTMDGLVFQTLYVPGGLLPNWELVNVGNYDGINKADFLFYDTATGDLISGIQDGATITRYNPILNLGPASGWSYH